MNISSPRVDGSILQLVGDLRAIFNPSLDMETVRQLTNRRRNCATSPPLSSLDSFGSSFLSFGPRLSVQLDGNQSRQIRILGKRARLPLLTSPLHLSTAGLKLDLPHYPSLLPPEATLLQIRGAQVQQAQRRRRAIPREERDSGDESGAQAAWDEREGASSGAARERKRTS